MNEPRKRRKPADVLAQVFKDAIEQARKDAEQMLREGAQEAAAELGAQLREIAQAGAARAAGSLSAEDFAEVIASQEHARMSLLARVADIQQRKALKQLLKNTERFALGIFNGIKAMGGF